MECLQEFIISNMEGILLEWEKFAETLLPEQDRDAASLRNDAQGILECIAHDMARRETGREQEDKSKGLGPENKASLLFSQRHTGARRKAGLTLNQVVSEYRALRASVIRLWTTLLIHSW